MPVTWNRNQLRDEFLQIVLEDNQACAVQVLSDLRARTPVDTGNAMRGWRISQEPTALGFEIENPVEYISLLDQGSSRQAPDGIIDPLVAATPGLTIRRR